MKKSQRVLSVLLCLVVMLSMISAPSVAHAMTLSELMNSNVSSWIDNSTANTWNTVDNSNTNYMVNKPQNYYTNVTSSVVDKSGNVTNYYRSGDTVNTRIVDSYNKTFNTVHNTTNNTNNYQANVKLSNFLNQYTTNSNNYTYSADFKSWYYDNTTNNYNYTTNNTYYNYDNSRYYLTIDNSTDEYYFVDIQYSPTFVTVNYTYNTTNINNEKVGDVTNVYYYELKDGRNSSTLTAAEVAGLDVGYEADNYELVTDDPNTLSLQHFDGDYTDSSSYNRTFYSQNRSSQYVDSGAFGQAVKLSSGSAAGVTIPNLSGYSSPTFDFRIYYADISNLGIYFGDTNIFQEIPSYRRWTGTDFYSDDGTYRTIQASNSAYQSGATYTSAQLPFSYSPSTSLKSSMTVPTSADFSGYSQTLHSPKRYGYFSTNNAPYLYSSGVVVDSWSCMPIDYGTYPDYLWTYRFSYSHRIASKEYRWAPSQSTWADFSYSNYKSQWVSMRITLSGNNIYYLSTAIWWARERSPNRQRTSSISNHPERSTWTSSASPPAAFPSPMPIIPPTPPMIQTRSLPCRTSCRQIPSTSRTIPPLPSAVSAVFVPPTPRKAFSISPSMKTIPEASPRYIPATTG